MTDSGDSNEVDHETGLEELARVDELGRWLWDRIHGRTGRRILDMGCGRAPLLPLMEEELDAYVGVDASASLTEQNRRRYGGDDRVRFYRADVREANFPEPVETFTSDTLLCLNLLEHLREDQEVLRRFHDLLQPGGALILQVPAHPWLYGSIDRVVGHQRRYRPEPLRDRMLEAGFESARVEYFNRMGILPWWFYGSVLKRRDGFLAGQPDAALGVYNRLISWFRGLDDGFPFPVGLSLLGFAVKPGSNARAR